MDERVSVSAKRPSSPVTRSAFEELRRTMRSSTAELASTVDKCCRDLEVQFERIAQIQAELDEIRSAWTKTKIKAVRRRR